jgi:hypothetical protein
MVIGAEVACNVLELGKGEYCNGNDDVTDGAWSERRSLYDEVVVDVAGVVDGTAEVIAAGGCVIALCGNGAGADEVLLAVDVVAGNNELDRAGSAGASFA